MISRLATCEDDDNSDKYISMVQASINILIPKDLRISSETLMGYSSNENQLDLSETWEDDTSTIVLGKGKLGVVSTQSVNKILVVSENATKKGRFKQKASDNIQRTICV